MINRLTEGVESESLPVPHSQNWDVHGLMFSVPTFPSGEESSRFEQKWINHEARLSIIFEHNRNLIRLKKKDEGENRFDLVMNTNLNLSNLENGTVILLTIGNFAEL